MMNRTEMVMLAVSAAMIMVIYLTSERDRILSDFVEAVQRGECMVTRAKVMSVARNDENSKTLFGSFAANGFAMRAYVGDEGGWFYELSIKPFVESIRVGPYCYGTTHIGDYELAAQRQLANFFSRLWLQDRRKPTDPDNFPGPI